VFNTSRDYTARALALLTAALVALAACGGDASGSAGREHTLRLLAQEHGEEYGFVADGPIDLRVGDRVTFELQNHGVLPHDLAVIHPDGHMIGTTPAAGPGDVVSVEVDLAEPGYYRLNCNVDDHLTRHGMQAVVEVSDSAD
jgi:uncharacterized cupredoxin-like copper-binding protein